MEHELMGCLASSVREGVCYIPATPEQRKQGKIEESGLIGVSGSEHLPESRVNYCAEWCLRQQSSMTSDKIMTWIIYWYRVPIREPRHQCRCLVRRGGASIP